MLTLATLLLRCDKLGRVKISSSKLERQDLSGDIYFTAGILYEKTVAAVYKYTFKFADSDSLVKGFLG